jgi:hypothetical protein
MEMCMQFFYIHDDSFPSATGRKTYRIFFAAFAGDTAGV